MTHPFRNRQTACAAIFTKTTAKTMMQLVMNTSGPATKKAKIQIMAAKLTIKSRKRFILLAYRVIAFVML